MQFPRQTEERVAAIAKALTASGQKLAIAESCTGGLLSYAFTQQPGASEYLRGSVIAYTPELKEQLLQVPAELIAEQGVVSQAVVLAMLEGVRWLCGAEAALATTGLAGPGGGSAELPVGTVWIAAAWAGEQVCKCLQLEGTREEIVQEACNQAVLLIFELSKREAALP